MSPRRIFEMTTSPLRRGADHVRSARSDRWPGDRLWGADLDGLALGRGTGLGVPRAPGLQPPVERVDGAPEPRRGAQPGLAVHPVEAQEPAEGRPADVAVPGAHQAGVFCDE